ncbi:DUF3102 domain-containing protein [Vagococcus lutrae]|uniref:DUF3102 domain-containing protein n=1 Tax=Vagococcus lutrae TaxID=81947 RepID=UPI00288E390C|nr:DUF3102 domain-containing protein [Vagococcus lutrae]MDT2808345.1 DUF3102 domain-containing protein [Vagococcus lutrae]
MNELALSTDINQIELEINYHKQIAGQSIWEIGRRLNHVKENDLAHGEFMRWCEDKINLTSAQANKYMKIANEFSNLNSSLNLGVNALYLISTLPEEQKQEELAKAEEGNPSTLRELQAMKKELKQKDDQIKNLSNVITEMDNKEPVTIEKKVVIEKKPDDYEFYKERTEVLQEEVKQLEESYRDLLKKRSEVDEKSLKYEELTKAINQAKGELGDTQKIISNYADLSKLLKESNEFLLKASGLVYSDLTEVIERDGIAKQELDFLINRLERFTSDLIGLTQNNILEGEIING